MEKKKVGEIYVGTKNVHHTVIPIYKYVHEDGSSKQVAQIKYADYKPSEFEVTEQEADELATIFVSATQLKQQLSSLQADNERLRKALQKIDSATYAHKEWTDMHKVNHIATEALQNK